MSATNWWDYAECPKCGQNIGAPCRRVYMGRLGRQPLTNPHPERPPIWKVRNQP